MVKITLMALLKRPNDLPRIFDKEISGEVKLRSLLRDLGYTTQEIGMMQVFVSNNSEVNNQRVSLDYILQNDDEIFVTVPVGGG
ncbi:MAG: hypothetical protein ACXAD7_17765 [Candidatus Kariarchaeaceae archaeon]